MRALFRLTVFLCVLALCCPLGATAAAKADKDKVEEDFEALRRFSQVLDLVNRYYVKDVNQGELLDGALKGMLQGLDPHSTFMTTEEHKEMQETTSGEFTGIGIEITVENGQNTYHVAITEVGTMASSQNGLLPVRAGLEDAGADLLTGISVKITASTQTAENAMIVPQNAVY